MNVCDSIRDHVRDPDVYVNVFRERVCESVSEFECERDQKRDP